jgi:TonB family protein
MARRRVFTPLWIASIVTAVSLVVGPWGLTLGWASNHEQRGRRSITEHQSMERQMPMSSQTGAPVRLERSPQTIDDYTAYVQSRLQAASKELTQRGTAELKLTIDKDGSIRQAQIVEVEGSPALREQLRPLVSQITPLPPLPGDIDVLVVTTMLAFDYPGQDLFDRFGQLSRSPG